MVESRIALYNFKTAPLGVQGNHLMMMMLMMPRMIIMMLMMVFEVKVCNFFLCAKELNICFHRYREPNTQLIIGEVSSILILK